MTQCTLWSSIPWFPEIKEKLFNKIYRSFFEQIFFSSPGSPNISCSEQLFEWAVSKKHSIVPKPLTKFTLQLILLKIRGKWINFFQSNSSHYFYLNTKALPELLVVAVPNPENPVEEVFNPNPPNPVEAVVLAPNPEKSPPLVVVVEPNPENRELDVVVVVAVLPKLNAVAVPVGFDPNPPKTEIKNVLIRPLIDSHLQYPWTQDITWMYIRHPGRLLDILSTLNLHPVSWG